MKTKVMLLLALCVFLLPSGVVGSTAATEEKAPELEATPSTDVQAKPAEESPISPFEAAGTCTAELDCPGSCCPGYCPFPISCTGESVCRVGADWVKCDDRPRIYCNQVRPYCTTTCCTSYYVCDKFCGGIGACSYGCCECAPF